jgi:hypothetical protein
MKSDEALKIQTFLRGKLNNPNLALRPRADDKTEDSAEVTLDGEFLGVIFKDTEDNETCYHFQWTIIEEDLDIE